MSALNGSRILLVNSGSTKKRFILQQLKKLGLSVVCLNRDISWAKPYVDEWIIADTTHPLSAIDAVNRFLTDKPNNYLDGIVTFWEDDVVLTARLAKGLGLPGIPIESALTCRNKARFREFCEKEQLPAPKARLVDPALDPKSVIEGLRFPLVVKPAFGAASAYVIRVDDQEHFIETVGFLRRELSPAVESALNEGLDLVVEEYIDGDEVDIDLILQNGKIKFWSITDNDQTNEPFFVETGETIPSRLNPKTQRELLDCAEELLERLKIQNGCIHFEAKASSRGPIPIEVNLRMGGDEVYYFIKHAWGYDLIEAAASVAVGQQLKRFDKPELPLKFLRGRYLLPQHSGVLSRVEVPEKLLREPGVEQFVFFKQTGDAVLAPPSGYDYLGWIIASGSTPVEAETRLDSAFSRVHYEIARFRATSSIGKSERKSPLSQARLRAPLLLGAARAVELSRKSKTKLRDLHVGVACNRLNGDGALVEQELASVGNNIFNALKEFGYAVTYLDFNQPFQVAEMLARKPVDLVFNVCERINGSSLLEPHAAAILDVLQIPYTGSNPFTLGLCIDKIRVKKLLQYHDLPTPRWDYCYSLEDDIDESLRYPRIVKPANSDNSIGITNDSVVTNEQELQTQLQYVVGELGRPALVEEYIEGDEYDVSLLGNDSSELVVLPLSRSIFDKLPDGLWHIYPFDAKYGDDSVYKAGISVQRPPKNVPKKTLALITEIAIDTYNILGCSDYGRVEIRVDKAGNPFVLELNPNPSINRGDCLPAVAELAGMDYGEFLEKILQSSIQRFQDRPPYWYLQAPIL